jgi:hypothetical protein
VTAIRALGGRDPAAILPKLLDHQPHLAYHPSYYILCPEPGEAVEAMRADLEDLGYSVLVINPGDDVAARLSAYTFWR